MSGPLPALLVVTDGHGAGSRSLPAVLGAAIAGGARAVLLREKHLPSPQRAALADALAALLRPVSGVLIVASDSTIGGDGVHLAAGDPFAATARLIGRSCHDRATLEAAAAEGCAYATLSPIFPSASKPGYGPALTPEALRRPPLPTWALGGVEARNAAACMAAGASGVAVMGAIMRASDPATATAQILAALPSR